METFKNPEEFEAEIADVAENLLSAVMNFVEYANEDNLTNDVKAYLEKLEDDSDVNIVNHYLLEIVFKYRPDAGDFLRDNLKK